MASSTDSWECREGIGKMNRFSGGFVQGIRFGIEKEMIWIEAEKPLTTLSSAVWGGGFAPVRLIINRHVSKFYDARDPEKEIQKWLRSRQLKEEDTLVLLTAAHVDRGSLELVETDTFRLAVFATAGVSNAARAGTDSGSVINSPGTVNLILLVDGELAPAAMVGAVITATEAKTAAFQDLNVLDKKGNQATGTTTDAIVVASTQRRLGHVHHRYAGPASPLGAALANRVYRAVSDAVLRERECLGGNGE
jgi:adenosylcobinamide hydrolase